MSVTIKIKEKIIDGKFKIPELVNPRQKLIELDNDEDISWEYIGTDDPEITVKALETFNGQKGGPVQIKGNKKNKAHTKVSGAKPGKPRLVSYDVFIDGFDAPLDPVIVIKDTNFIPHVLRNPFFTFIVGVIVGLLLAYLM